MKKKKNSLNKKARQNNATDEDKQTAAEAKLQKEKDSTELANDQEKAYRKDFWKTVREVTNGKFGEPRS